MPKDTCKAELSEDVVATVAGYLSGRLEGYDGGVRVGDRIVPAEAVRKELRTPGSPLRREMVHAHLDGTAAIQATA